MPKPEFRHDIEYYKKKRHEEAAAKKPFLAGFFTALKKKKGIIIGFTVAFIILLLPLPHPVQYGEETITLTREGKAAIALLVLFVIIFITDAMPFGMTMALVYSWIVFFRVVPARRAASLFSHDAVWFLVGALMMASVLIRHNIHLKVLNIIIHFMGSRVRWVVFGIVLFCGITSMFIAGHTMAAVMLPVGVGIVNQCGGYKKVPRLAKCLMLAIAYGAGIGGLATPSGGGRNVIMMGLIEDYFHITVTYRGWMIMAMPLTLVLVPIVTILLLLIFKPEVDRINHISERADSKTRLTFQQWATIAIFLFILALWITISDLGIGMIAMFGSLLYLIFGLADWDDFQRINWSTVMLYFAAIGLGKVLQDTAATRWLAAEMLGGVRNIGVTSGFSLTAASSFFMTGMTQTMSDGPCVASMGPMLLDAAKLTGNDPVIYGISIAIASSFAFAIIIGTPPNAIVHSSGFLKARDFLKVGVILSLLSYGLLLLMVRFYWSLIGAGSVGIH